VSTSATIDGDRPELGQPIAFRLPKDERARLLQLARRNDRVPGAEVRRAVRFYLANFETVDRVLRELADAIEDGSAVA